jgi:hypothetical protein
LRPTLLLYFAALATRRPGLAAVAGVWLFVMDHQ